MTKSSESRRARRYLRRGQQYRSDGLPKNGYSWSSYKTRRRKYSR